MASFVKRDGAIQVSIRRKGFAPIYKTFDDTYQGERAAHQWAEDIELQIKHKRYIEPDTTGEMPLREALLKYAERITPEKKGAKAERNRIIALTKIPLTDRTMGELKSPMIADWRDRMIKDGYSATSINSILSILSRVYVLAATEWGVAIANPVKGLRRPVQNDARERRLEAGEEERLFEHLPELAKIAVTLLIETAMRRGELTKLMWRDVNLARKVAILRDTKNGDTRAIPLSSRAITALVSLPKKTGQVIPLHPDTLTHQFNAACAAAGIVDLRLHDLRHEATSRFFERGTLSIMEVASITGHKDLKMLMRYTHLDAGALADRLG